MCSRYILERVDLMNPDCHLIVLHHFPQPTCVMLPFLSGVNIIEQTRSYDLDVLRAQFPAQSLISDLFILL